MRATSLPLVLAACLPAAALAQPAINALSGVGHRQPITRDQPVTFTADSLQYDRDAGIVTATGHVEAWQNDHVLRADKITYDRNTGIAAATGHVVLLEPDGEILFSDYAELAEGMKDGVLRGMRALLAQNGKLAANGARRTDGVINELSKAVYTTCDVCKLDPDEPPLWQLRALTAIQDTEHKRIEYYDATLEVAGVPVFYLPYFNNADPSVKRASGLLIPSIGTDSHLGQFYAQPFYLVLDDQSDVTITPQITTKTGGNLDLDYRRYFNDGRIAINGSVGTVDHELEGALHAVGRFNYDDTWRYGFLVDTASSLDYLRDFRVNNLFGYLPTVLTSTAYLEGFGVGAYARLDARTYESLSTSVIQSELPIVLPRFQYSYINPVDSWGGRLSLSTDDYSVFRTIGERTQRASLTADYVRPFDGSLGERINLTLHGDAEVFSADRLTQEPVFSPEGTRQGVNALPQAALDARWPFIRDAGDWGTQIVEPRVQIIVAPQPGHQIFTRDPNEDSVAIEFTDATLFSFNRFQGIDRQEGGTRINYALSGTWDLDGIALDALIGQSYRLSHDRDLRYVAVDAGRLLNGAFIPYPQQPYDTGLQGRASDYVGHVSIRPTDWLDLTYRTRVNHDDFKSRFIDAIGTVGGPVFSVNGGYLYSTTSPYSLYDRPTTTLYAADGTPLAVVAPVPATYYQQRQEVSGGFHARLGGYTVNGFAIRDLALGRMVAIGGDAAWENECVILDVRGFRRYTAINYDNGATTVLFQVTLKTVGQFGFHAF